MKSKKGKNVVRQRTAKSRLARALAAISDWCRTTAISRWRTSGNGCPPRSQAITPATASPGISRNSAGASGRPQSRGASGWPDERARMSYPGTASTRSSNAAHCPTLGSITTPRATKLSGEEPDAGNLRVRDRGGRRWQHPRLPGRAGRALAKPRRSSEWGCCPLSPKRLNPGQSGGAPRHTTTLCRAAFRALVKSITILVWAAAARGGCGHGGEDAHVRKRSTSVLRTSSRRGRRP
jgi:hypothetical protein